MGEKRQFDMQGPSSALSPSSALNQCNVPQASPAILKESHVQKLAAASRASPRSLPASPMPIGPFTPAMAHKLQEELRQTQATARALQVNNDYTHKKLERLHTLPQKEQSNLRDLMATARKGFDQLKEEKERMIEAVLKAKTQGKARYKAEREQRKALEVEVARLKAELEGSAAWESIVDEIDTSEITAIEREKVQLNEAKVRAETVLAEVNDEMTEIDNEADQVMGSLLAAMQQLEDDMLEAQHGQQEAEAKVEESRQFATKAVSDSHQDDVELQDRLTEALSSNRHLQAEIERFKGTVMPLLA